MHGTHTCGSHGVGSGRLGDTEIRHLYISVFRHNDILRLYISVNHMVLMSSLKTGGNLDGKIQRLVHGESAVQVNVLLKGDPLNKLHDDKISAVILADVKYTYNVGMRQSCGSLRLHTESGHERRIVGILCFQNLQCHISVKPAVLCPIYR